MIINLDGQNGREQLDSPAALPTPEPTQQAASCQSVAVAALQEEVTALRAEIASLQAQLANFKNQANNQRQQADSESPRREARAVGSNLTYCDDVSSHCAISHMRFSLCNDAMEENSVQRVFPAMKRRSSLSSRCTEIHFSPL